MNTLLHPPGTDHMQHRVSPLSEDDSAAAGSPHHQPEREFTLGTTTILGIFFALALLCAVFFAFGYSLGNRHTQPAAVTAQSAISPTFTPKPSPGNLYTPAVKADPAPAPPLEKVTVPVTTPAPPKPEPSVAPPADTQAEPHAVTPAIAAQPIVQVAAVSHQEDAELIASTLKRRGYAVLIRSEPQDKLLHLQLGPFSTKKDAEAMRQRLLADGFNAYIK